MITKATLAAAAMLLISSWFGLQAWLTQTGIQASSALAFNTQRYIAAALVMGGICLVTRAKFTKRAVFGGFTVGVVFSVLIGVESQALSVGSAGRVTFLGSLFVAITPFLAYLERSEKIRPAALLGSAVMLLGAWQLLMVPGSSSAGDIYGLLRAGICSSVLLLVQRYAHEDWRVSSFINLSVVAIISFIAALMTGQNQFSLQPEVLTPVIISALVGSVGAVGLMTWCSRHISATTAGVLYFMDAPFAVIWGVLLYKELLTPDSLLAYLLIALGAMCALTAGSLQLPHPHFRLPFHLHFNLSPLNLD
jgi:drug/metabolite transporter (DMT)-like permease